MQDNKKKKDSNYVASTVPPVEVEVSAVSPIDTTVTDAEVTNTVETVVVEDLTETSNTSQSFVMKEVTMTGKIRAAITPELVRLEGFSVALLGESGPGFILTPDGAIIFKTNIGLEGFVSRGASLVKDEVLDGDVVASMLVLVSSVADVEQS
jgi:hypothetical protein